MAETLEDAVPTPEVSAQNLFDTYLKLYDKNTTLMMHYDRSQYILIRAFFQIVAVVFVVEHLPLQFIQDAKTVLALNVFMKASLLLISYTILRKSHLANYHDDLSNAYWRVIRRALKSHDPRIDLGAIESKITSRYAWIDRIIFPRLSRISVGVALLLFSITVCFTITIK